jgi:RNA polymerase sigma-70 factor (ECF subfamily)
VALHQKAAPVGGIHALDHTDARAVQRALQTLPFEQREVVALKVDAELTFAEIGEILGLSPNAAASRSRYALARLRAALQEVP